MQIEILKQPIILNPHTTQNSNNPYFYSIPSNKILQTDKLTIIGDFHRFMIYLQPELIFPTQDLKRNCVVIPNDWKSKFRKETSQKSLFKILFLTTAWY